MFCPHKNSYLQLVCAMNPRIINKAVDRAMQKRLLDPHEEYPPAQRMDSMQPSLYAPHVDISRAKLGYGRVGLRIINRELHSKDYLVQLQALHSILDQVQISESALFLIKLHIVYRIIDLMKHRNPIIREKICMILSHLATYYQGRMQIMTRPIVIENLLWLIERDRKEIRYAAAYTLRTLSRYWCPCQIIMKNEFIIENLLTLIKHDHVGIVLLHLRTLENLIQWDEERALRANAFQLMLVLFDHEDPRIVFHSMDVMTQLCKHDVGKKLADEYDLTFVLRKFLVSPHIEIVISAVGLMIHTTITTRSKWRAKEVCMELTKQLVQFCCSSNKPALQLRSLQVLINLCDCPDVRYHMKHHWEHKIKNMRIRTHEDWDGTSETSSYGIDTGHYYRTMCIEKIETIKNDGIEDLEEINVHSYLRRIQAAKEHLIRAMNWKSYKDFIPCKPNTKL